MPFLQIASFAMPFCVMPLCVLPFCVLALCAMPFCALPRCVMPLCVMPFCVLALSVMPLCVLPFSAWYLYDSGLFSISSFYRGLFFFTNFDLVYFRFDLTLFTFRLLNIVIDIPSYHISAAKICDCVISAWCWQVCDRVVELRFRQNILCQP